MSWKHVAYMDESHNSQSYWICGVVVDIERVKAAQEALVRVAEEAAESYDFSEIPELHGYDLFQGEGAFEGLEPRQRIRIYDRAVEAVIEAAPAIVIRGVRRENIKYQHPHRLAWRYAIESVDALDREGPILVVADEHAETELALRGDIQSYISYGTGGWKPRVIEKVLPELKFLDSKDNSLLQAADLVAFLHQRRQNVETERDPRSQTAREALWARLEPFVAVSRIWEPGAGG